MKTIKRLVLFIPLVALFGCANGTKEQIAALEQKIEALERAAFVSGRYDLADTGAGLGISTWTAQSDPLATGDLMAITDVSDTSGSSSGTSKKITIQQLDTYTTGREIQATASNNIVLQLGDNAGTNTFEFEDSDGTTVTDIDSDGNIYTKGDVIWLEKADHTATPIAGSGYLWTKNTTPSTLIFTDDAGTDTTLGSGGSAGPYVTLTEQSSSPGTPSSGSAYLWATNDTPSLLKFNDDTGASSTVLAAVSDDTAPELGGNLDVASYHITSDGNVVVRLPDASGTYIFRIEDSNGNCVYAIDSDGNAGAAQCP